MGQPTRQMSKIVPKLVERDGTKCHYCGCEMNFTDPQSKDYRTIDHKIPKGEGGGYTRTNLVLSCWRCNHNKGNRTDEEFTAHLQSVKQNKRLSRKRSRRRKAEMKRREKLKLKGED